jgi:hypothetical protein
LKYQEEIRAIFIITEFGTQNIFTCKCSQTAIYSQCFFAAFCGGILSGAPNHNAYDKESLFINVNVR